MDIVPITQLVFRLPQYPSLLTIKKPTAVFRQEQGMPDIGVGDLMVEAVISLPHRGGHLLQQ